MDSTVRLEDTVTEYWVSVLAELQRDFVDGVPSDFLRNPRMRQAIVASDPHPEWPQEMLAVVLDHFGPSLTRDLLVEGPFGAPLLNTYDSRHGPYVGTHYNIQHLAHIARWREASIPACSEVRNVVEWGGGFGNTARLMHQLYDLDSYTIIDLPYVLSIQREYLERNGVAGVSFVSVEEVDQVSDIPDGLFISTWALSECKQPAIDYVANRDFFGARHLLLACQPTNELFADADSVKTAVESCGRRHTELQFREGFSDYYLLG